MPDGTASNRRNIAIGVGAAAIVVLLVVAWFAWLAGIFGPTTLEPDIIEPETTEPDTQEPQQEHYQHAINGPFRERPPVFITQPDGGR